MNRTIFYPVAAVVLFFSISSCQPQTPAKEKDEFSFVFMTDIHLEPERNAPQGFQQAIDTINALNPDFVLTGGDMIMDALGVNYERADSLYTLYQQLAASLKAPLYNTMGNHEIFGLYSNSEAVRTNPEYGEKMFEKRLGKSYYSFEHKGWKFIVLNSVEDTKKHSYIGLIDSVQVQWLKNELDNTDKKEPIVVSTHIPLLTIYKMKYDGSTLGADSSLIVINGKEVIDMFKGYNLKLVLQAHLHTVEEIYVEGTQFITGGAVSSAWWQGLNRGFEEGFMVLTVKNGEISAKYKDYGWEAKK